MIYHTVQEIHTIFTSIMVGVIWVMQIVHYPIFRFVKKEEYNDFQNFHMKRISYIVVPSMIVELLSGIIVLYLNINISFQFQASMALLIIIWMLTGFVFSNIHNNLLNGFNIKTGYSLILWNWVRTTLWSIRLFLIL
ncbi:MAG: hypothetical protein CMG55_04935 [Candidatus Marinimicrobia bacterium]|nr:hypothetical protein [Candidatus Neomarinimicrobiota bacterium]